MSNQNNNNAKARKKNKASAAFKRDEARDFKAIRDGNRNVLSPVAERYLRALVDPFNAKDTGVPTLAGGDPGKTRITTTRAQGKFVSGVSGFGYVTIANPEIAHPTAATDGTIGPYNGTQCGNATSAPFNSTSFPSTGASPIVGLEIVNWTGDTELDGSQNGKRMYRLVGMAISVFPESSFSTQNGSLSFMETPEHVDLTHGSPTPLFTEVEAYETTRTLRATQTGSQEEKLVVNWHPRSARRATRRHVQPQDHSTQNDFSFVDPGRSGWAGAVPLTGLTVLAEADPGTQFHYKVVAMWELKGTAVRGATARFVDSRGMDLVINVINAKRLDGYVGNPAHVYESYLHQAGRIAVKLGVGMKAIAPYAARAVAMLGGF
jgi:hypothetical protein